MWNKIQKSKNKLFIIRYKMPSMGRYKWYIAQEVGSSIEDAQERQEVEAKAKKEGIYRVHFQIRYFQDSATKPLKRCRYWPEEVHLMKDGDRWGPIVPVAPSKVESLIKKGKHRAYDDKIDLMSDSITGPFNFAKATSSRVNMKSHLFF